MSRPHVGTSAGITGRLDAIEWVRAAAACGVIWFHIKDGPYKEIGHAGLICFVLISVVFQAAGPEKEDFKTYLRKKTSRILIPWSFWLLFYGLFNLAKGKELFGASGNIIAKVLSGTWVGLWYLPFILLVSPLVYQLSKMTSRWKPLTAAAVFLGIGLFILFFSPQLEGSWKSGEPWGQWLHALPAVPLGIGIHAILKTTGSVRLWAMLAFLLVVELVCRPLMVIDPCAAVPYGVAVCVTTVGFLVPVSLPDAVTKLGGLTLGVYLLHSAVITLLRVLPPMKNTPLLLWISAVIMSFALTALLRRNRWFARVL